MLYTNTNYIIRNMPKRKLEKYAGLKAMGTFMILYPKKTQAQSAPPIPGGLE